MLRFLWIVSFNSNKFELKGIPTVYLGFCTPIYVIPEYIINKFSSKAIHPFEISLFAYNRITDIKFYI